MAKIIECVQARYEVENVEFGKVYKWRGVLRFYLLLRFGHDLLSDGG